MNTAVQLIGLFFVGCGALGIWLYGVVDQRLSWWRASRRSLPPSTRRQLARAAKAQRAHLAVAPTISISSKERCVIEQLVIGDRYGLELVDGSAGTLPRNAIYVLLGRMEDSGLIEGREVPSPPGAIGPPRRKYRITVRGIGALRDRKASPDDKHDDDRRAN